MTDTTLPTPVDASRPDRSGGAPAASVDYEFAKRTGRLIVNPGPQVSSDEAAAIVADLRAAAAEAVAPVAETSALHAPADAPDPLVVDRRALDQRSTSTRSGRCSTPSSTSSPRRRSHRRARPPPAIGGKVTGAEVGGLLAFLSGKVLGQYDLAPGGDARGCCWWPRTSSHVERELGVDPADFRLWVCLHEETHRVQFTAVPWLRDHMLARSARRSPPTSRPTPSDLVATARGAGAAAARGARSRRGRSLADLFADARSSASSSPSSPPSCRCSRATPTS